MKKIAMFVFLTGLIGQVDAGVETSIPLEQVPSSVRQVVEERFSSVKLISANTEQEADGTLVYEMQGTIPAGQFLEGEHSQLLNDEGEALMDFMPPAPTVSRKVEFDVLPNGDFEEIEIEFLKKMVPGAVIQALHKTYPGFKASFIEASYSDSMDVVGYELEGQFEGKELDIEISPSSREITIADR